LFVDIKKAKSLLTHPAIIERPNWGRELEKMLETNTKAEIQAISSLSLSYLSDKYPKKKKKYFYTASPTSKTRRHDVQYIFTAKNSKPI
jgi:hypothetical protein